MKVGVSVLGKFHAFNLAAELAKRGALSQFISSYPATHGGEFGIPRGLVSSALPVVIGTRALGRLQPFYRRIWNSQYFICRQFDRWAAKQLRPADIFVGWSGSSIASLHRAKALGSRTVIERGSAHMTTQQALLEEEFALHGQKFSETHPRVYEQELLEYELADFISVPSAFAKRTFIERGVSAKKLLHIPYGVDLTRFKKGVKPDKVFRIIFCGNLSFQKGVQYLVRAFSELGLPNSELLLIGSISGEFADFFSKHGNEPGIVWKSKVPQSELPGLFGSGSVFCLPSVQDGFGMVIPQAMACGLPVLATTNTGAPDIVTDGQQGFIVPIRSVEALKERIQWFYDHPTETIEMGERARQRVAQGFSWTHYGDQIFLKYSQIL